MSQRNDFDPYDVLGVLPGASPDVINAAFRAASKLTHPDSQGESVAATQQQQALNSAHEILKNPAKRAAYDAELKAAFQGAASPKTMGEARRRLVEAESTAQSLKAALAAERRRTTSRLDAELQAQLLNLQQTNHSALRRQALDEAWAEIGDAVTSAIRARDEMIDQLSSELAEAEGQLAAPRPHSPSEPGRARGVLWGVLVLAFLGSAGVWLWQAVLLGIGAWHYAPSQTLWPAVLRNQWVLTSIVVVVTLALGLAPSRALERESLWMFLWPALAAAIWVLSQPAAFGAQLWEGAASQITLYVIGYVSCFMVVWLIVATPPD